MKLFTFQLRVNSHWAKIWDSKLGASILTAIDRAIFSKENFGQVHQARQGSWRALSPRYLAWKRRHGYPSTKWVMTGETLKAMTNSTGVAGAGISRNVTITRNDITGVSADVTMHAPAARGYFDRNNKMRPFMTPGNVLPTTRRTVADRIEQIIKARFRARGWR